MPITLSYTDTRTGAVYPAAEVIPMRVYAEADRRWCRIVYHVYASLAAVAAGLAPVDTREVVLSAALFDQFATGTPDGATLFDALSNACYVAAAHDDVLAPALPGPG